jgi:hypothetical protein
MPLLVLSVPRSMLHLMRFGTEATWPPSLLPHVERAQQLLDAPSGTVIMLTDGAYFAPIEVEDAAGESRWIVRRHRPTDPRAKSLRPTRAVGELAQLFKMGVTVAGD